MRRSVGVIAILGLVLSACSWTQFRGDGRHSGVNPYAPGVDTSTITSLQPAWTSAPNGASGEVAVRNGRAFVNGNGALRALDLAGGAERWHVDHISAHQINRLEPPSTLLLPGGPVVAMSEFGLDLVTGQPQFGAADGLVRLLDPATGQLVGTWSDGSWSPPIDAGAWIAAPVSRDLSGIHAQVHIHDLVVRAPDGNNGFVTHLPAQLTDVVGNDTTTFAATASGTYAVPAHGCGANTCGATWSTIIGEQLALGDGTLFGISWGGVLAAVPAAGCGAPTCAPAWSSAPLTGSIGGIAVTGKRVYVTTGATLSVFDAAGCGTATCAPLWSATGSGGLSAPTVVNDLVLVGTDAGDVQAWRTDGCGATTCPALATLPQGGPVGPVSPIHHALVFTVGGAVRKLMLPG